MEKIVTSPISGKKYCVVVEFDVDLKTKDWIEYTIKIWRGTKPKLWTPPVIEETFKVELDESGRLKDDLDPVKDISNLILAYEAPVMYAKKLEAWDGKIRTEENATTKPAIPKPPELSQPVPVIHWDDPPEVKAQKEEVIRRRKLALAEWLAANGIAE